MKKHIQSVGIAILLMAAMGAQAGTISYGDFPTTSVSYENVNENTDIGAYQAPTASDNNLSFSTLGIKAEATGGSMVTNNAILNFGIRANAEKSVAGLLLSESGDLNVLGSGTDATFVDVSANVTVVISEVNGTGIADITRTFSINDFTPKADGTWELLTDGTTSNPTPIWDGEVFLDFAQMLSDNGYNPDNYGTTFASVTLENILIANSEGSSYANIHKKEVGGLSVEGIVIPEPASAVLLVGTASLMAFIRRRFIG